MINDFSLVEEKTLIKELICNDFCLVVLVSCTEWIYCLTFRKEILKILVLLPPLRTPEM